MRGSPEPRSVNGTRSSITRIRSSASASRAASICHGFCATSTSRGRWASRSPQRSTKTSRCFSIISRARSGSLEPCCMWTTRERGS